jgi:succinyl-CoA synthetase beta subunit
MVKLVEFKGKQALKARGLKIPRGVLVRSLEDAAEAPLPCVLKAQALVTGRKGKGLVRFADTREELERHLGELLGSKVGAFTVDSVLVEEKLDIEREFFAAVILDDRSHRPIVIYSSLGGSGIEEIAREHPEAVARQEIDFARGLQDFEARDLVRRTGIDGKLQVKLGQALVQLYAAFRDVEARSMEINPLVLTTGGDLYACDCHLTVDDYAVFRHPELEVPIARELDHPATELEMIAYNVEKSDYRGTFYFIQLEHDFNKGDGFVGFHGAGGGGSMMSMDGLSACGFRIANFTDTSGNPPASKVYRAAKIILQQGNIDGYFASGSGVASQEQFHSARGFVKAFREMDLKVPAVIRLGGNREEVAIEILDRYCSDLNAPLEAYGKDDSARFCAERLQALIEEGPREQRKVVPISNPDPPEDPWSFETVTGRVTIDQAKLTPEGRRAVVESCSPGILEDKDGKVVLNIPEEDAKKGKCTECLACEIASWEEGCNAIKIDLPIPGLDGEEG